MEDQITNLRIGHQLHQMLRDSRSMLKLDITKAFDSVSWAFLIKVMQHMGFGQIWRHDLWSAGLLLNTSFTEWLPR